MELKEFQNYVDAFLVHLDVERNLSSHTVHAYTFDLKQLIVFWKNLPLSNELTMRRVLERYFVSLFYKKIEKSTIARKFSCFRSFEQYLRKQNIILNLHLTLPRLDKKLPIYLSIDELFRLLDYIQDDELPTKYPIRDKTILELLYATGVRCAELVGVQLNDIDMEQKTIRIYGKGKKERMVLFGQKAKDQMLHYIEHERLALHEGTSYLFLNAKGKQITCRLVQRVIHMFRQFLAVKRPITPHKIRHSFATHLLSKGADLRVVQELLGHKTMNSTEKYTHVTLQELSDMCNTIHPLKKMLQKEKEEDIKKSDTDQSTDSSHD